MVEFEQKNMLNFIWRKQVLLELWLDKVYLKVHVPKPDDLAREYLEFYQKYPGDFLLQKDTYISIFWFDYSMETHLMINTFSKTFRNHKLQTLVKM